MIRRSSSTLAPGLLHSPNTESHKRDPSSTRLMPNADTANGKWIDDADDDGLNSNPG